VYRTRFPGRPVGPEKCVVPRRDQTGTPPRTDPGAATPVDRRPDPTPWIGVSMIVEWSFLVRFNPVPKQRVPTINTTSAGAAVRPARSSLPREA